MTPGVPTPNGVRPRRVGVVGGGAAGIDTAWLLDGACEVVLFEAEARLGGHAHSVTVEHRGRTHAVDLGAQLFGPLLQPRFVDLLTLLGMYDPAAPDTRECITRSMGITVFDEGAPRPRFVSPVFWSRLWPVFAPWNLAGQAAFLAFARNAPRFEADGDWDILLDDWLRGLPGLSDEGRERILLPWISALAGCSIAESRVTSARAAIAAGGRGLPKNLVSSYRWSNVAAGLATVYTRLVAACRTLTPVLGDPVVAVRPRPGGAVIHTRSGRAEAVDAVVFAAPPPALAPVLDAFPGLEAIARVLPRFTWFRSRLVIHTDPVTLPPDRRSWSAYTAAVGPTHCEGSIWYGAIRDREPDGGTVDLFKSWCSARARPPREVLHEAEYRHPLITPDYRRAQAEVDRHQGRANTWFVGSWVQDVDLQETALLSAVRVARALAPGAPNLTRLLAAFPPAEGSAEGPVSAAGAGSTG